MMCLGITCSLPRPARQEEHFPARDPYCMSLPLCSLCVWTPTPASASPCCQPGHAHTARSNDTCMHHTPVQSATCCHLEKKEEEKKRPSLFSCSATGHNMRTDMAWHPVRTPVPCHSSAKVCSPGVDQRTVGVSGRDGLVGRSFTRSITALCSSIRGFASRSDLKRQQVGSRSEEENVPLMSCPYIPSRCSDCSIRRSSGSTVLSQ